MRQSEPFCRVPLLPRQHAKKSDAKKKGSTGRERGGPEGVLGHPAPFHPVPDLQKAQVWVFSTEQRRRAQLFLVINRGQQSEMRPKGEVSMFEATLPLLIPLAAYLCAAVAAVIEHGRNRNCLGGAR